MPFSVNYAYLKTVCLFQCLMPFSIKHTLVCHTYLCNVLASAVCPIWCIICTHIIFRFSVLQRCRRRDERRQRHGIRRSGALSSVPYLSAHNSVPVARYTYLGVRNSVHVTRCPYLGVCITLPVTWFSYLGTCSSMPVSRCPKLGARNTALIPRYLLLCSRHVFSLTRQVWLDVC